MVICELVNGVVQMTNFASKSIITIILFVLLLFYDNTNGIAINNFAIPIEWKEVIISGAYSSMITILDSPFNNCAYLCGGKISLFDKSSKCIRIQINKLSDNLGFTYYSIETLSDGNGIKSTGEYPGVYLNAKSFISSTQNEGGIYGDRMCILSIYDNTNNPKSWCCDIKELQNENSLKCNDLQYTNTYINSAEYHQRFESCIAYDGLNNILYQIGGYYGQMIVGSILCFDLKTETYLNDDECKYMNLNKPMYSVGCTVMHLDENKSTIVSVGGLDTLSISSTTTFSDEINICNSDNCKTIMYLNDGVLKTRVFAIDYCHIGIVGGTIQIDGLPVISSTIDIANICTQEWIYNDILPLPLAEMGIIKTNDVFCLYGGISFDNQAYLPQLSKYAYCINIGNDTQSSQTPWPTIYLPTEVATPQSSELLSTTTISVSTPNNHNVSNKDNQLKIIIITIILIFPCSVIGCILFGCIRKIKTRLSNISQIKQQKRKHIQLNRSDQIHIITRLSDSENSDDINNNPPVENDIKYTNTNYNEYEL